MRVSSLELADVIRKFGQRHNELYGASLMPSQKKCLQDIQQCMTPDLGGSRYHCEDCNETFWRYHGCGNRSCPKCLGPKTEQWLEARRCEILPCPYFHVVATMPAELRSIAMRHQKIIYGLFMKVSAECVIDLAKDKRYIGGTVGIMAVLHTWNGQLGHHPHSHMLVTGGGIDENGQYWMKPAGEFLVHVKALSKMIRGRFSKELQKAHPEIYKEVPSKAWKRAWCSFCKPFGEGNQAVLNYLSRYVFRIAISNSRILEMDDTHVKIRYKNHDTGEFLETRIAGVDFISRFLQHVLPKGFHKVRYYGLWAPANREKMIQARLLLGLKRPVFNIDELFNKPEESVSAALGEVETRKSVPCPKCGGHNTVLLEELDPVWRKTPA